MWVVLGGRLINCMEGRMKKALDFSRARGDEWTRTTDSRIFSPMLYQLSYITFPK